MYAEDMSVVWSWALPTWVSHHGAPGTFAEHALGEVALSSISLFSPVPLPKYFLEREIVN